MFGYLLLDMVRGSPESSHVQHASAPDAGVFGILETASKELALCP